MSNYKFKTKKEFSSLFHELKEKFKETSIHSQLYLFYFIQISIFLIITLIFKFKLVELEINYHVESDGRFEIDELLLSSQLNVKTEIDYLNYKNSNNLIKSDILLSKLLYLDTMNSFDIEGSNKNALKYFCNNIKLYFDFAKLNKLDYDSLFFYLYDEDSNIDKFSRLNYNSSCEATDEIKNLFIDPKANNKDNWANTYIKNMPKSEDSLTKMIKFSRSENNKTETIFIYFTLDRIKLNTKNYYVIFGNQVSLNNIKFQFLTDNSSFLLSSIYSESNQNITGNEDYSVTGHKKDIIQYIPSFIENTYIYGTDYNQHLKVYDIDKSYEFDDNTINLHLKNDLKFLKLIPFFIHYSNSLNSNNSKCYYSGEDLLNYYNYYNNTQTNCLMDVCNIMDCKIYGTNSTLYQKYFPITSKFRTHPQCLCLPMLCYDDNTFEVISQLSDYEVAYSKTMNQFQISSECSYNFDKKEFNDNNNYPISVKYKAFQSAKFSNVITLLFLQSNLSKEIIIRNLKSLMNSNINIINSAYSILVGILIILFIKQLRFQMKDFSFRVDLIKSLHKKILEESQDDTQAIETLDNNQDSQIISSEEVKIEEVDNIINKQEAPSRQDNDIKPKSKIDIKTKNEIETISQSDELRELFDLINNNISEFFINFKIAENVYKEYSIIQYYDQLLTKKRNLNNIIPIGMKNEHYTISNRIAFGSFQPINESDNDYTGNQGSSEENCELPQEIKDDIDNNFSKIILSELASVEFINIDGYNKNLFFRRPNQKSLFDLYEYINLFLFNDDLYINEMFDEQKLQSVLSYIYKEIIEKWLNNCNREEDLNEI